MSLPQTLQKYSSKLSGGVDVDPDGWKQIFTKDGWQFATDPLCPMHIAGAATVTELARYCRSIVKCACADCKKAGKI